MRSFASTSRFGQRLRTGAYFTVTAPSGTGAAAVGELRAAPLYLAAGGTVDRIGVEVTTGLATATARLGIYSDDGNGLPGALLLDAGSIDASSAGFKELTISQTLGVGTYWLASLHLTAAATFRISNGVGFVPALAQAQLSSTLFGLVVSGQSAFPATFPSAPTSAATTSAARVYLRAA